MNKLFTSAIAVAALALAFAGCDYSDDNTSDHNPPPGLGSIAVQNNTANDINVYIDGTQQESRVNNYDNRAYDVAPGVHRVILDQHGGDRTFRDDVDAVADRRTVMDVAVDPGDPLAYDVAVFLD